MRSAISTFVTLNAALLLSAVGFATVHADHRGLTLAVVMTNDPNSNQIKIYDTEAGTLLQALSTNGTGGAAQNARGREQRIQQRCAVQARRKPPEVREAGQHDKSAGEHRFR